MPCGPKCSCLGSDVECLSVVDPARFAHFKSWCESGDEAKRRHVLGRSRIGTTPTPAVPQAGQPTPASPSAEDKPCCGGQPPGLLVKAGNFARAAFEHVAAGSPEADEPTASARLAICLGCEHLNAHAMTCNICGCSMPKKVYWYEQHCPIGKW